MAFGIMKSSRRATLFITMLIKIHGVFASRQSWEKATENKGEKTGGRERAGGEIVDPKSERDNQRQQTHEADETSVGHGQGWLISTSGVFAGLLNICLFV